MKIRPLTLLAFALITPGTRVAHAGSRDVQADIARRAALHPVADAVAMRAWLNRVPLTRDFPPDFTTTLQGEAPMFIVEMTTSPGCVPCADLWEKLHALRTQYRLQIALLPADEAMVRSGRLGLPWIGHPVAWVRARNDPRRVVPVAIGTDHRINLARNIYLGFKMMTGVRPAVGVRAMAKFTGITGATAPRPTPRRK